MLKRTDSLASVSFEASTPRAYISAREDAPNHYNVYRHQRSTAYLNTNSHRHLNTTNPLTKLHLPPSRANLPSSFPDVEIPRFLYGDRLCWLSDGELTDWGIVIGRFYSFAPHRRRWGWCYLIWLDPNSPSSDWVRADIAWEDDLEPIEME
ncbi:MAG: hypothetical protein AAF171_28125 [Cyanobacteria bacterium P01_A01_bin.116]